MSDEEMIELDNQARLLARRSSELLEAGDSAAATACLDQAIAKMQQVADEMNRQRDELFQRIEALTAQQTQSADQVPPANPTPAITSSG